jgi:hypothetical protein
MDIESQPVAVLIHKAVMTTKAFTVSSPEVKGYTLP